MKITVKYFSEYAKLSGCHDEEFFFENNEVINVKEVFKNLSSKYNIEYKDVIAKGIILVNSKSITQPDKENTELKDGDKLILMPMISGG
ncbi:hypothetical protein ES705_12524 [subsurface metagenome]